MPDGRRSSAFADYVIGPAWLTSIVRRRSSYPMKHQFFFFVCFIAALATATAADRSKNADDVHDTALRYVLAHYEAPDLAKVPTIYVTIDRKDPSDAFIQRFATHKPPVLKASAGRGAAPGSVRCALGDLKWISDDEAEIRVGREHDGGDYIGFIYTVSRTPTGWKVSKLRITAIT